ILCDLDEAELLIVVGANPFGGIDRAFLECGIDVAAGKLLRHTPDLGNDGAGKAADTEFQSFEIFDRFDLLAEPAAHLRTGGAGRDAVAVKFLQEIVEQVLPTAPDQPGNMLARV